MHLAQPVLDALGNGNFALAGQQLDGAHFTHVHAHRIGCAADFGFHGRQRRRGFFRRRIVVRITGGGVIEDQGVRIRRFFVHLDAHVVDHVDDVFDLFRIDDVIRQVIVDLRVGKEALFLALGDQVFELGCLFFIHRYWAIDA